MTKASAKIGTSTSVDFGNSTITMALNGLGTWTGGDNVRHYLDISNAPVKVCLVEAGTYSVNIDTRSTDTDCGTVYWQSAGSHKKNEAIESAMWALLDD